MAARRPAWSCHATSIHQPDVVRPGDVDPRRARGLRVEQASVVRQRGRRRAQHVGAGRRREALERARLVTHQRGRVGPPALGQRAGLAAGERVVRQRRLHELVERAQPLHLPPLATLAAQRAEQVQGAGSLRRVEVRGQLEHALLAQRTRLVHGGPEQVSVVEVIEDRLAIRRFEIEPVERQPCRSLRVGLVLQELREERPRAAGGRRARARAPPTPADRRHPASAAGPSPAGCACECRRARLPSPARRRRRLGQLGESGAEHAGGLEEPPRTGVAALDDVEELGGQLGR